MRDSREVQYQRNVTFSLAVGWIKKLMILDSTNWVGSQEKGKKSLANARKYKWSLEWTYLRFEGGKVIEWVRRKFSAGIVWWWSLTEKTEGDRIRVNFAQPEHVNHIYSHLKVHSFQKSLDSSTCELSFYHDVSFFWQKCLYTAELASASCNTPDRMQLEALKSLYEREKTKNQVKTTAGAVSV